MTVFGSESLGNSVDNGNRRRLGTVVGSFPEIRLPQPTCHFYFAIFFLPNGQRPFFIFIHVKKIDENFLRIEQLRKIQLRVMASKIWKFPKKGNYMS